MPFDMVVGTCNPVAPPIEIWFDPPKAVGKVVFTPQYEGAPGCVHGAAIAAAFDIVLTAANVVAGAAGPTVELTHPLPAAHHHRRRVRRFESGVTEVTDRRTYSTGRLLQDGVVTVEATGEFVNLSRERINAMHRDRDGGGARMSRMPARRPAGFSRVCSVASCRGDRSSTCRAPTTRGRQP